MRDLCSGAGCQIGTPYCAAELNSTGLAGRLRALGSEYAEANMLVLQADRLPAGKNGMFFMGDNQVFVQGIAGGQGNLCVGNPLHRLGIVASTPAGSASRTPDFDDLPPAFAIFAGTTWNFQYWFRDENPGPTSNLTDGVEIAFQ